jgi:hypothetical protein
MRGWIPRRRRESQDRRYLPIFLNVFLLALLRALDWGSLGLESLLMDLTFGSVVFQDTWSSPLGRCSAVCCVDRRL